MKVKNILSFFLILILLAPYANAQFANYTEKQIKAVAVVSGENKGATIDISVIVTPGTGRVFVSVSPFTEIDMQGSAQLAALTACDLTGNDFLKHDFFYTIEAKSTIVGGPSAGAVMTIATIAALENLTLRKDVYMTGMIYPDGSIGPVGGIKYKLEAAAENGAKIFLIPKGQRYEKVLETEKAQKGPFIIVNTETKTVDLVKYGQSLGVKVVEIENITEALKYYAGVELKHEEGKLETEKYADLMKILAERMKKDAMDLYKEFEKVADSETKKSIDERLKKGEEYYSEGYYYSSTSTYFTAKILMREEIYRSRIKDDSSFSVEEKVIRDEIESTKRVAESYEMGLASFQIVGAAQERLAKAENYLEKATTASNWDDAIVNLALAKERVESAKVWMSLLPEIKEDTQMNPDEIKRRADFYLSMAESLFVYAGEIGGVQSLLYGDSSADESLKLAEELYNNGYYAGTVFAAIDSMVKSAISIEVLAINSDKDLNEKINTSKSSVENAIGIAEKYTIPMLPYAYYEFGETSDGVWKLYYYKLSERIAKTLVAIGGKESVELVEVNYRHPEMKITPEVPTIVERQIEKIFSLPGFEGAAAVTALLAGTAILRRVWRKG
ncbi:S16 family serine protease [Geoglobus acetivorans]|uniref:Putative ATP-dependent protease n=1 Tax=Geoglobus acetivorans TaxID=565033 RepID=A0A0A7GCB1_GEOAI|nr:putative ATP-dependent protease [Geoglobus acetivorans]